MTTTSRANKRNIGASLLTVLALPTFAMETPPRSPQNENIRLQTPPRLRDYSTPPHTPREAGRHSYGPPQLLRRRNEHIAPLDLDRNSVNAFPVFPPNLDDPSRRRHPVFPTLVGGPYATPLQGVSFGARDYVPRSDFPPSAPTLQQAWHPNRRREIRIPVNPPDNLLFPDMSSRDENFADPDDESLILNSKLKPRGF